MPKSIVSDALGEILETGKSTAKAGKQAAGSIVKAAGRAITGQTDQGDSGLEWLEKGTQPAGQKPKAKPADDPDAQVVAQIDRMKAVDKKQSAEAYKQIQDQIAMIRRQKASQPRKYVSAAVGYDKQQHEDPETFWDKVKKKQEKLKEKLPWNSKQGMGTGEIRRGASG